LNIYAWIGLIGIILFTGLPLLIKSGRTRKNIIEFSKATGIVIIIILLTEVIQIHFIMAFLIGCVLFILFDKKTYTKKRLIIYGSLTAVFVVTIYFLFRSNPDYVLNHLQENPDSTSLYVAVNDEEQIGYQADVPRPLASVVKIVIAMEYAYQTENGELDPKTMVPISVLNRFYIENTDGGAHANWLEQMEHDGKIHEEQVELHEVAKGMITYSSNANTDFLINLLGMENINNRIDQLGLIGHDDVLPLVGSLLVSNEYKKTRDDSGWMEELRNISDEEYKELAQKESDKLKNNEADAGGGIDLSIDEQRIWSDRLPNAPASTYGRLLQKIANGDFPDGVAETMQELMEWPMEMVEENKNYYQAVGSKGGSTAFVLNEAMYVEDLEGNQYQIVLLMDDLSLWESLMLQNNLNTFIVEMINSEQFLQKVKGQL